MKKAVWLVVLLLAATLFIGCTEKPNRMHDGYYTAEAKAFDAFGWKEYVTIFVANDRVVTVEYNAHNVSGFIKSWDQNYMRTMNMLDGTYPNEYTRYYASQLVETQDPEAVDGISGATNSFNTFKALAAVAIEQAKLGQQDVALVELPNLEEELANEQQAGEQPAGEQAQATTGTTAGA